MLRRVDDDFCDPLELRNDSMLGVPGLVDAFAGEQPVIVVTARKPYNEAKRGAEASLVTSMGRMACHTGRTITYEAAAGETPVLPGRRSR